MNSAMSQMEKNVISGHYSRMVKLLNIKYVKYSHSRYKSQCFDYSFLDVSIRACVFEL